MSSGSTGLVKIDFLKTPIFQTDTIVTSASPPSLKSSFETGEHAGNWNIGKRGKPTKVKIPMTTYVGGHTWNAAGATTTAAVKKVSGGGLVNISSAAYDSSTGRLTITTASAHGVAVGGEIRLLKEAYAVSYTHLTLPTKRIV